MLKLSHQEKKTRNYLKLENRALSLSLQRKQNRRSSRSEREAKIKEEMNTESQTTTPVNATFLANLKDRFSGLVNTPMDEHKTCFKNTMDKVRSQFSISPSTKEKVRAQFSISYWMPKDDAQKKVDGV
ncbi:Uncharacterized protein Rs2_34326 [Raphanus sativus]|nr:Uncharacterized protein Rs2_34326 [Raphanus sativus]